MKHKVKKGKKIIIFDDMTRITRAARIAPFVVEELAEAGIPDGNIRFIVTNACHGVMDRADFAKKLGEATMARFPVYNHNPFFNCTYAGTTSYGTEVYINAEFMSCDFKIAIGGTTPHGFAVYSGGGKMVLPGVASFETIKANHRIRLEMPAMLDHTTNARRLDMEEAAKLVGLDVSIECIMNGWGDTVAIYAGSEPTAYATSVEDAKMHFVTPRAENRDIVIGNTYAKANEATTGLKAALSVRQGGDLVLIGNSPDGQIPHYLIGSWGKTVLPGIGQKFLVPGHLNRLILFTEYPDLAGAGGLSAAVARLLPAGDP